VHFQFALDREKLRTVRRREGRYLLRSNLTAHDPAELWQFYLPLVEVEAAFKNLKDDRAIRPIVHQREDRTEAHIFVAFPANRLHVTLRQQLKAHAPGLTACQVPDRFARMQLFDVHFPPTDRRELPLNRDDPFHMSVSLLDRKGTFVLWRKGTLRLWANKGCHRGCRYAGPVLPSPAVQPQEAVSW
jgi:hypothetical protein